MTPSDDVSCFFQGHELFRWIDHPSDVAMG